MSINSFRKTQMLVLIFLITHGTVESFDGYWYKFKNLHHFDMRYHWADMTVYTG